MLVGSRRFSPKPRDDTRIPADIEVLQRILETRIGLLEPASHFLET
jgi:hypothetical protein